MNEIEDGEVIHQDKNKFKVPKFQMKSSNYRTKVCEHFKKGACKNGANCSFQHPKEFQSIIRICKYFLGGSCQNLQCQYSHDVSKYQCKFHFVMGNCKEPKCRFSHDIWENEFQKQQWLTDNDQFIKDMQHRKQIEEQRNYFQMQQIAPAPFSIFQQIQPPAINQWSQLQQEQFKNIAPQVEAISDEDYENENENQNDDNQESSLQALPQIPITPQKKKKIIKKFRRTHVKKQKKIFDFPIRQPLIELFYSKLQQ